MHIRFWSLLFLSLLPYLLTGQTDPPSSRNSDNTLNFEDCDEEITIHPIADDFQAGYEGRVLISALHGGGFYTDYQIGDAQVKIEVLLPMSYVGQTVYFRLVTPDADDLSEYEPGNNNDPGDNLGNSGSLSQNQAVVQDNERYVDGVAKAVAEVTLGIDHISGDDYQVEASLSPSFDKTYKTARMFGWKRIYVEYDQMYRKGATLTQQYRLDLDDEDNDVLQVDNTSDFEVGDEIIVFTNKGKEYTDLFVIAKTNSTLIITDLNASIHEYGGVRLASDNSVYQVSRQYLTQAYGANTDGSDEGAFVEYYPDDRLESGFSPKLHQFMNALQLNNYATYWFKNIIDNRNIFYLLAATKFRPGEVGLTQSQMNRTYIFLDVIEPLGNPTVESAEVLVHEFGHQFALRNDHVDRFFNIRTWDNRDACIMSYFSNFQNGIADFDGEQREQNCFYGIREASDPR